MATCKTSYYPTTPPPTYPTAPTTYPINQMHIMTLKRNTEPSGYRCGRTLIIVILSIAVFMAILGILGLIFVLFYYGTQSWTGFHLKVLVSVFFYLGIALGVSLLGLVGAVKKQLKCMKMYFYLLIADLILTCLAVILDPAYLVSIILKVLYMYLIYRFIQDLKSIKEQEQFGERVPKYTI